MEELKTFVINLSTILVFMTAIEIIAPENSMKKYIKFVLGLILIAFMINPIIYFTSHGEDIITNKIKEFSSDIERDYKESDDSKEKSKQLIEDSFKSQFEGNLKESLKHEFSCNDFRCELDGELDYDSKKFSVDKITVYTNKSNENISSTDSDLQVKTVEKIEPIDSVDNSTKNKEENKTKGTLKNNGYNSNDELQDKIISYVSENVNVSKDKVVVIYK